MTICGDGSSLVNYETQTFKTVGAGQLEDVINALFARLDSDEVDFDTTTGNIEFPFSNGQSDLTGKTTWIRIFPDWVFLRLREMGVNEELGQTQTLVINGLYQKSRQRLGLELQ